MTRVRAALPFAALLVLFADGPAWGQGFTRPLPTPPPVPVRGSRVPYPAASTFTPAPGVRAVAGFGGFGFPGFGYGYFGYTPWFGGYGWGYGGVGMQTPVDPAPVLAPPLQGAGGGPAPSAAAPVAALVPARLTVEFPAPAEVWVDGQKQSGENAAWTFTSSPLGASSSHTFDVKATWAVDGKKYEWSREVTVAAGESGRVTVSRGFPVKD